MLNKDFENFELKLKTLREESREDFNTGENIFNDQYKERLEEIFPRDILGAKKLIAGSFMIEYVDGVHGGKGVEVQDIFMGVVERVVQSLPLNSERKESLRQNIIKASELSESLQSYFASRDDISRDPFFALVEDFSIDGDISKEEYLLLEQSYDKHGDFLKALESLPQNIQDMFLSHIGMTLSHEHREKKSEFESEYSAELQALKSKGIHVEPVVVFVSRSFYKTPGKYRKYEHPKRRMRRTFKIALLRLLRAKLGNIDASIMLEKFESGESFEDFFLLLFKLLEVINEDTAGEEIYSMLKLDEELEGDVVTAEENKQKILAGESLIMKIASLFSKGTHKDPEEDLEDGILDKLLDESTDIVGEDIYFNRQDNAAGIYDEGSQTQKSDEEQEETDYDTMSPSVAYEMLQHQFHKVEEKKREAFLKGLYDDIDAFNDELLFIESKLSKLCAILGLEQ